MTSERIATAPMAQFAVGHLGQSLAPRGRTGRRTLYLNGWKFAPVMGTVAHLSETDGFACSTTLCVVRPRGISLRCLDRRASKASSAASNFGLRCAL